LQTLTSNLGEKLQPLLEHLASETNDALVAQFERGAELIVEFLVAALQTETDNSYGLFFRILCNGLAGSDTKKEFEVVVESLKSRAPELLERCAEAIAFVVSCFSPFKSTLQKGLEFKKFVLQIVVAILMK
jgi:hypothetical protein